MVITFVAGSTVKVYASVSSMLDDLVSSIYRSVADWLRDILSCSVRDKILNY